MTERASQDPAPIGRFDRFAEATSRFVSEAAFFTISTLLVVIWVPTIALFSSVDTWQLVLNTVTSVLAFLLIALLQNSERRYDRALHTKVDAITEGLLTLIRLERDGASDRRDSATDQCDGATDQCDGATDQLDQVLSKLEAARGIEGPVTADRG
jgi:low affinity Fe/Cu permease